MTDQGQHIIDLAQELLRSDFAVAENSPPPMASVKHTVSIKILCLVTILTAMGSSAITAWTKESNRPINRYQRTELDALISYTAKQRNVNESILRHDLELELGVQSFDDLTRHDYLFVRHYLRELTD